MDCNNAERSATEDKEEQTEEPCSKKLRLDDHSEEEKQLGNARNELEELTGGKTEAMSSSNNESSANSPGESSETTKDCNQLDSSVPNEDGDQEEVEEAYTLSEFGKIWEEEEALLGGCSKTECSYKLGSMPRQPLYICTTCAINGNKSAGICLACASQCHEGHDIMEIYTKRDFTCDCGNSLFPGNPCKLEPSKKETNTGNAYDQTFEGLYCKCHRPYPDESAEACDSAMVQCIVCEDWYHMSHLGCGPAGVPDSDAEFAEVICDLCMAGNAKILSCYYHTLGAFSDNEQELKEEDEYKEASPCRKPKEADPSSQGRSELQNEGPESSSGPAVATFWKFKWRNHLCKCDNCLNSYQLNDIPFISDWDDSLCEYERRGREAAKEEETKLEEKVDKLGPVGKFVVSHTMGMLEHELKAFLSSPSMQNKEVITDKDMRLFTENWKKKMEVRKNLFTNFPPSNCHNPNF